MSGARKPATLETGLVIQVPLFVNPGDRGRKVDTRSGDYITRAWAPPTTPHDDEPLPGSRREACGRALPPALRDAR